MCRGSRVFTASQDKIIGVSLADVKSIKIDEVGLWLTMPSQKLHVQLQAGLQTNLQAVSMVIYAMKNYQICMVWQVIYSFIVPLQQAELILVIATHTTIFVETQLQEWDIRVKLWCAGCLTDQWHPSDLQSSLFIGSHWMSSTVTSIFRTHYE